MILDRILGFKKKWDDKLTDPVWETVSMKMKKYSPFLNIDVFRYKKILKEVVLGDNEFFDSEVVRAEMVEISELQDEVYKNVFQLSLNG